MKTVKSSFKVNGAGLMSGAPVELEIKPSDEKGIRFYINDGVVEAKLENVVSTEHCVVLADVEVGAARKIALIEHFMAACAILEIDALDVYFSSEGFEMPIFDGSAKVWIEKFNEVGFDGESEPVEQFDGLLVYNNNNSSLIVSQNNKNNQDKPTNITYMVNYRHPDLENKWAALNIDENLNEIIEARTFGYLSDLDKLQAAGFSKGVTIENTLGLKDDGGYTSELRSKSEPIKHKILDIIGDFYLTGYNPLKMKANILVKEAGHAIHIECAKTLKQILDRK